MCARSCAWNVGHSTRQKLERSERAIAAVDCHSSPAGAGKEIGRVASFRVAAPAMPVYWLRGEQRQEIRGSSVAAMS